MAPVKLQDAKSLEAEINRLQSQLQALKAKTGRTVIPKTALPLEPAEFTELLKKMLQKRFPGQTVTITSSANEISVESDESIRQWVSSLVKKLAEP